MSSLSDADIFARLWQGSDSLKSSLITVLDAFDPCEEVKFARNFIKEFDKNLPNEFSERVTKVRDIFFFISQLLRSVESSKVQTDGFCDVLHILSRIKIYFTPYEY